MSKIELICGDCLVEMKKIPDKSIDLVLTDPPFFLKLDHFKTRTWFAKSFSDLSMIEPFFKAIFQEFNRIVKQDGYIFVFCDGQSYPLFWHNLFSFTKSSRPLVWDKKTSFNGYGWRHQYELIIFAEMPECKPIRTGDGDILRFNAVKVSDRVHPAQKPTELIEVILKKVTKTVVLDPFMGSGTVGMVCKKLDINFIGIEIDKNYFEIAKKRIENTQEMML